MRSFHCELQPITLKLEYSFVEYVLHMSRKWAEGDSMSGSSDILDF